MPHNAEQLQRETKRISFASIAAASRIGDEEGREISINAVLKNKEANRAYEAARNWRKLRFRPVRKRVIMNPLDLQIKPDRKREDALRRLKKMSKQELIERLILVEGAYAGLKQTWLEDQNKLLHVILRPTRT